MQVGTLDIGGPEEPQRRLQFGARLKYSISIDWKILQEQYPVEGWRSVMQKKERLH